MNWQRLLHLVTLLFLVPALAQAEIPPPTDATRDMLLTLRGLDRTARVLLVTAHPDDEDSGLLVRLRHVEGVETGLLTLTRGEGGQNEIGTELFHALGVLRSRELEAAAQYTGVQQYFSRAFEFGYSFSVEESFDIWGREAVLRDIVAVLRQFQPDVVLTLPTGGPGGGQHHQASARLTLEAFHIAGTSRWPELGQPHQASRLFAQIWGPESPSALCEIEVGNHDPVLGDSPEAFGESARAQHKCQGMARVTAPLARRLSRWEWMLSADADDPPRPVPSFFSGLYEPMLVNSLGVTEFGSALMARAEAVRQVAHPGRPDDLVTPLLELHDLLQDAKARIEQFPPSAPVRLRTLEERVGRALEFALQLRVDARTPTRLVAVQHPMHVELAVENAGVRDLELQFGVLRHGPGLTGHRAAITPEVISLPPDGFFRTELTLDPKVLREPTATLPVPEPGDSTSIEPTDRFFAPAWATFVVAPTVRVDQRTITLPTHRVQTQELRADFPRVFAADPQLVPEPSIRAIQTRVPAPRIADRPATTEVEFLVSSLAGGPVRVNAQVSEGWLVDPPEQEVMTTAGGVEQPVTFTVRAPDASPAATQPVLRAQAVSADGTVSTTGYRIVDYPHIRPGTLLETATVQLITFPCRVPDVRVGYIAGTGDEMPQALRRLGIEPQFLTAEDLQGGDLSKLDVIITGVRAYKVREDLKDAQQRLMAWTAAGGVLLVQYNKFEFNAGEESSPFAPYPDTQVGSRRVTVEGSPVVVNHPDDPLFHEPNVIGEADWSGWVQERGLYFLDLTDPRYRDLITLEDPWPYNAGPKGGALVTAPVGEGHWVYLGIGLFRQLPAAVPGAYRLLGNLLGLAAQPATP